MSANANGEVVYNFFGLGVCHLVINHFAQQDKQKSRNGKLTNQEKQYAGFSGD